MKLLILKTLVINIKTSIIVFFLSLVSMGLFAQNKFENKQFDISFHVPSSWSETHNEQLYDDMEKLEITEDNLAKFIAENDGTVQLMTYYKYGNGSSTKTAVNPTIRVAVKSNNTETFNDFKKYVVENCEKIKSYYSNVDFKVMPTDIEISGMKAIHYSGDYTVPKNKRKELVFERRDYIIPYGKYYFIIELSDGTDTEDNSALFDRITETIKIGV